MRKFYFLRHGETDWNSKLKLLQGHTDIPLNSTGHQQAAKIPALLKLQLQDHRFDRIICSDLTRAKETASYLTLPTIFDRQLREIHLGIAEGRSWDDLEKEYPPGFKAQWSQNSADNLDLRFEGGESRREVTERVLKSILSSLNQFVDENLLFVSHGFVIRSLVYHSTDIQVPFFVPNCALVPFGEKNGEIHYLGPRTPEELTRPIV